MSNETSPGTPTTPEMDEPTPPTRELVTELRTLESLENSGRSGSNRWLGVGIALVFGAAFVAAFVLIVLKEAQIFHPPGWIEGRRVANRIMVALNMHASRHDGQLPGVTAGPVVDSAGAFGFDGESLGRLDYFAAADFTVEALDTAGGTYTLVVRGSLPNSPPGELRVNHTGATSGP